MKTCGEVEVWLQSFFASLLCSASTLFRLHGVTPQKPAVFFVTFTEH